MSWLSRLDQTYQKAVKSNVLDLEDRPIPPFHTRQNAHINIVLDEQGNFRRASVLPPKTNIVLPATENSEGRTGQDAPHALADTVQYVAADYLTYGGDQKSFFETYKSQLKNWCDSEFSNTKIRAVFNYISKESLLADLIKQEVFHLDADKKIIREWTNELCETPQIFSVLPKKEKKIDPRSALICWSVEIENDFEESADTWKSPSVFESWISYYETLQSNEGFCFASGTVCKVARLHPAKLRHGADKAKLISSNDSSGMTFRGRFHDSIQAATVGSQLSQNAHSALRWLVSRQGFRFQIDTQNTVAWAVSGMLIPNPALDPMEILALFKDKKDLSADLGKNAAEKLKKVLYGYRQKLSDTDQLSILVIDSATPGRMAINYYREFMPDDYFTAINCWYEQFAWFQRLSIKIPSQKGKKATKTVWSILSPSPLNIANTAYGETLSTKQKKQVISRVLPCIVEGESRAFPFDLVQLCVNRACCPTSTEKWEWERNVGVACALYRGFFARHPQPNKRRVFPMSLDENNITRDYLYGRLLAVAEYLEGIALYLGGENRSTTAERYMQRFAERPFSTWKNIELALVPYKDRLKKNRHGFLVNRSNEISAIMDKFDRDEFVKDEKLNGEFLLGYHCQKMFYKNKETDSVELIENEN